MDAIGEKVYQWTNPDHFLLVNVPEIGPGFPGWQSRKKPPQFPQRSGKIVKPGQVVGG